MERTPPTKRLYNKEDVRKVADALALRIDDDSPDYQELELYAHALLQILEQKAPQANLGDYAVEKILTTPLGGVLQ